MATSHRHAPPHLTRPVPQSHPAIARVASAGFVVGHSGGEGGPNRTLWVWVTASGVAVATAEFAFRDGGSDLQLREVWVDERYRRQGLATAMYVYAEAATGCTLDDFWSR